jgi:hypothetical protein
MIEHNMLYNFAVYDFCIWKTKIGLNIKFVQIEIKIKIFVRIDSHVKLL